MDYRILIFLQHHPFIVPDKLDAVPDRSLSPFLATRSDAGYQGDGCYSLTKILETVVAGTPEFHGTRFMSGQIGSRVARSENDARVPVPRYTLPLVIAE